MDDYSNEALNTDTDRVSMRVEAKSNHSRLLKTCREK